MYIHIGRQEDAEVRVNVVGLVVHTHNQCPCVVAKILDASAEQARLTRGAQQPANDHPTWRQDPHVRPLGLNGRVVRLSQLWALTPPHVEAAAVAEVDEGSVWRRRRHGPIHGVAAECVRTHLLAGVAGWAAPPLGGCTMHEQVPMAALVLPEKPALVRCSAQQRQRRTWGAGIQGWIETMGSQEHEFEGRLYSQV
jgi:hypothetical protein